MVHVGFVQDMLSSIFSSPCFHKLLPIVVRHSLSNQDFRILSAASSSAMDHPGRPNSTNSDRQRASMDDSLGRRQAQFTWIEQAYLWTL